MGIGPGLRPGPVLEVRVRPHHQVDRRVLISACRSTLNLPTERGVVDQHWTERAACRGVDTEIFFPEALYPTNRVLANMHAKQAREICARCPVRIECLDEAMRRNERHGIWGGLLRHERERLKKRPA